MPIQKRLLVNIGVIVLVGAICFSLGYYIRGPPGPKTVRIGHLVADIHQIGFYVAYNQGYWKAQGIIPERFEYLYGMPEVMDFEAGRLDAGYVGCVPAIIAKSKGADLVILASANLEGSAIVAKLEIENVSGLNNKIVGDTGLGSIQSLLIKMVMENFDLTFKDQPRPGASFLPLKLEKGEIDAFIAWEPFCAEAVVGGYGHVIYTSHDILPDHQCCVFYVSGKMLREDRELAKKLLIGHLKAMKFAQENVSEAMGVFENMTGKSRAIIENSWGRMVFDPHPNVESLKIFVPHLVTHGFISPEYAPENIDAFIQELVDTSLLEEIKEKGLV